MQKSGFPNKLFWMAFIVAIGASALALTSRFRLDSTVNVAFKTLSSNEPSLIEHFLGSMAASGIALLAILLVSRYTAKAPFRKTRFRTGWFVLLRRRMLTAFSKVFVAQWVVAITFIYVAGSWGWEYSQMQQRGFFQAGQFSMDALGGLVFCTFVWFSLQAEYKQAREKRRLSFA